MNPNDMPARQTAFVPETSDNASETTEDKMVLPSNTLESVDVGMLSSSPDEAYRPPSIRARSILGDDAPVAPTTPAYDPRAAERVASDNRIYTPPSVRAALGPDDLGEDDEYAGMFGDHSAPVSAAATTYEAPAWDIPTVDTTPVETGPVVRERDFGAAGFEESEAHITDAERLAAERDRHAQTKQAAMSRADKKRAKEEERERKAREKAEEKAAKEAEARKEAEAKIRKEAEESRQKALLERQRVLAQNARDAARAREKAEREEQRRQKRGGKGSTPAAAGETSALVGLAGSSASSSVSNPAEGAGGSAAKEQVPVKKGWGARRKAKQLARAAAAEQKREAKASAEVAKKEAEAAKEQARVDAQRAKEAEALTKRQAKQQGEKNARIKARTQAEEKAQAKAERANKRGVVKPKRQRRHKGAEQQDAGADALVNPATPATFVPEGAALTPAVPKGTFPPVFGSAGDGNAAPERTSVPSLGKSAPDGRNLTHRVFIPPSLQGLSEEEAKKAMAEAYETVKEIEQSEASAAQHGSNNTNHPPAATGSRRNRRLAMEASTTEEQKVLTGAEHAALLKSAHESLVNAETEEAERQYRAHLESITSAAKRREIEMSDGGITLADDERSKLKRSSRLAVITAGVVGLLGGLAVGVMFADQIVGLVPIGDEPADAAAAAGPVQVQQLTGVEGEVVRLSRVFSSEECGPAVVIGVIGPQGPGTEFLTSDLEYTVNGQPATPAEPTETCVTDTSVASGAATSVLVYLDAESAEAPAQASIAMGNEVTTWTLPQRDDVEAGGEATTADQSESGEVEEGSDG